MPHEIGHFSCRAEKEPDRAFFRLTSVKPAFFCPTSGCRAEAIQDLKQTLGEASAEERRSVVREHVTKVQVPRNGPALLEANPAGLLRGIKLVTQRGHAQVAKAFGEIYLLRDVCFVYHSPAVAQAA